MKLLCSIFGHKFWPDWDLDKYGMRGKDGRGYELWKVYGMMCKRCGDYQEFNPKMDD